MSPPDEQQGREAAHPKQHKESAAERREREKHEASLGAINSITNQLAANQEEQNASDRKKAFREKVTIGLVFLAFAATVVGDGIFYFTMRDARSAAVVDHRAWIDAPVLEVPSPYNATNNALVFEYEVHNIGKTPATGLFFRAITVLKTMTDNAEWLGQVKQRCVEAKAGFVSYLSVNKNYAIMPNGVAQMRDTPTNLKNRPVTMNFNRQDVRSGVRPRIVGCIAYGSAGDGTIHTTGFTTELFITDQGVAFVKEAVAVNPE